MHPEGASDASLIHLERCWWINDHTSLPPDLKKITISDPGTLLRPKEEALASNNNNTHKHLHNK